jgi:hypothetical protein
LPVDRGARLIHIAQRDDILCLRGVVEIHAALPPHPMAATFSLL